MTNTIFIQRVTASESLEIAEMVGELLNEIMSSIGTLAFHFDLAETAIRLGNFITQEKYFVFVARDQNANALGFIALYESYALYAEGSFGTIPELYVRPKYRSKHVGLRLLEHAKDLGLLKGWKRLEVTTPPLPEFEKTLSFYKREGFTITGGRKLKIVLDNI